MGPRSEDELEELLSRPDAATVQALAACEGDLIILGAGGKMGPTIARMARRALDEAGLASRAVTAVSRFSDEEKSRRLEHFGVQTVKADLLDPVQFRKLPDAKNVLWLAGRKFGSSSDPIGTWADNVLAPSYAAERYSDSRVVCFSTGNVYGRSAVTAGGSRETDPLRPDGEYAASCIGRERVFEAVAMKRGTSLSVFRLFYACDLRYGVVTDLAFKVLEGRPVSLDTGWVNVIWQGDANRFALRSLALASNPATIVNVTGAITAVKDIALALASAMDKEVSFTGEPGSNALVADNSLLATLMPAEVLPQQVLIDWTASWVAGGLPTLNKPTAYEKQDGRY